MLGPTTDSERVPPTSANGLDKNIDERKRQIREMQAQAFELRAQADELEKRYSDLLGSIKSEIAVLHSLETIGGQKSFPKED